jgi:hypothetical protein
VVYPGVDVTVTAALNGASLTGVLHVQQQPQLPAPVFNVNGGTFVTSVNLTMADSVTGASIYYTLDGTAPTAGSSAYASAISITSDTTVKAIAIKTGYRNSDVTTATFTKGAFAGVDLTSPANGASFSSAAFIAVTATPHDSDGTVTKVDFYLDGSLTKTITTAPFQWMLSGLATGSHAIYAVATDDTGLTATSGTNTFTVTCGPPDLGAITLQAASVTGGTIVVGTVWLNGAARTGGEVIMLTSSNPAVVAVPDSILIPAGADSANFNLTTYPVSTTLGVTITASYHGATAPPTTLYVTGATP